MPKVLPKNSKGTFTSNKEFIKGLHQLFDCYRPLDIQKKMWEIVSNPKYVADPAKGYTTEEEL
jgi:D-alanyl-D-alanine dipeptidase